MLKKGRAGQQNIARKKQRKLIRVNLPMFFLFLGGILVVCFQSFNAAPVYASARQVQGSRGVAVDRLQMQHSQSAHSLSAAHPGRVYDACTTIGAQYGNEQYVQCERELANTCQDAAAQSTPDCYKWAPLSIRCQNPLPQDLEACMTQNSPYSDPNYKLPSQTLDNPLGTTFDDKNNVQQNNAFFVITPTYATVDNQTIQDIWGIMLGIVDVAAVILLLLAGLSMIFSGMTFRQADALELLPTILLALVVANASMGFMHFFIGLGNNLSGDTYSWADSTLKRTLAGYSRNYVYPQFTYIISLHKGDEQHNALARYDSDHQVSPARGTVQLTNTNKDVNLTLTALKFTIYKNDASRVLSPNELPQQPIDKNVIHPGFTCSPPGRNDYTVLNVNGGKESLLGGNKEIGEKEREAAFQKYNVQADPQKYYDRHDPSKDILGYYVIIHYQCFGDVALKEKYLPFYPSHITFNVNLFSFLTQGLEQSVIPLVISVLGAIVYAQMLVRLLLLNFYIVISPLGIACWGLPGKSGQRLAGMWLSGFISLVMVQFLQTVALIITQVMIGAYLGFFHKQLGNEIGADLLEQVLGIATLWFTLLIPNLLGTSPMRMLVEAGQEMGQVAGAAMAASMASSQAMAQGAGNIAGTLARML